jgi:hypothetical protein
MSDVLDSHVKGRIVDRHPTRTREFDHSSVVFDLIIVDAPSNSRLQLCFYNDWARAVSFANTGDEITLRNFQVRDVPEGMIGESGIAALPSYFVTPANEERSVVVVAQPGPEGDTLEVTVHPRDFDNPEIKVRRTVESASNGVSMSSDIGGHSLPERAVRF